MPKENFTIRKFKKKTSENSSIEAQFGRKTHTELANITNKGHKNGISWSN